MIKFVVFTSFVCVDFSMSTLVAGIVLRTAQWYFRRATNPDNLRESRIRSITTGAQYYQMEAQELHNQHMSGKEFGSAILNP
jgi:hypothetical protein